MQRRDVVLGVMAGMAGGVAGGRPGYAQDTALPVPASGKIGFNILRNGVKVGEHHLTFTQNGDQLQMDMEAALVVKVAGIAVFRYNANATEHWSGTNFCGVNSKVNHDGTPFEVHASPIPGGFAVRSTKAGNYQYTGTPTMMPLTYWNKAMLDSMILNIETGRHYPAFVSSPGWNYLNAADGGKLQAQRFDVTGKLHFSVWYDQQLQWSGLDFYMYGDILFQKMES